MMQKPTMNVFSFNRNWTLALLSVICIVETMFLLVGCYSFTGGSVSPHLRTISAATASDNSGFGNPAFREFFTQQIIAKLRSDNSLTLVDDNADARLSPAIVSISDATVNVSAGELERERKVSVTVEGDYFDAVKNKQRWKKNFSNSKIYEAADGQAGREQAILNALREIADDMFLEVVSEW
ncbi:LptE family protein [Ignavibacteria bacterium]|nr:hypothetical protein [Bacteroidota bacterium]MCZ2132359.1 LPS assembly lipoprotein LptE [Bacteroidota bacterium]